MNKTYAVLPIETNSSNDGICDLLDTYLFILPDCRQNTLRITAAPIELEFIPERMTGSASSYSRNCQTNNLAMS
jgi:hypothetical protein